MWQKEGFKGFYRGWWITVLRDVSTYGLFFLAYDSITRNYINEGDSKMKGYAVKGMAGGIAGIMNWIPSYPFDIVKSFIQIDESPKTLKIMDVVKKYHR